MTVATSISRMEYLGNGTTDTFPYTFKIYASSNLVVTQTDIASGVDTLLALTTDYTVTGVGSDSGGSVVLVAGNLAAGQGLTIRRVLEIVQETIYTEGDNFPSQSHEDALDKACMIDQQLQEQADRSLHFPEGSTAAATLPINLTGSPLFLQINAAGTGIAGATTLPSTGFDLDWIAVQSYGTALDDTTLSAALAANPTGGALYFGAPFDIDAVVNIPDGFVIVDGRYQIFACTGAGKVTGLSEVHPEWFGADPTETDDSSAAVQSAFDALNGMGLFNVNGKYKIESTVIIRGSVESGYYIKVNMQGNGGSYDKVGFQNYNDSGPALQIGDSDTPETYALTYAKWRDFFISGRGTSTYAGPVIDLYVGSDTGIFDNVYVEPPDVTGAVGWLLRTHRDDGTPVDIESMEYLATSLTKIKATAHGLETGQRIILADMTQADWQTYNNVCVAITVIDSDYFSVAINSNGWAAYVPATDPGTWRTTTLCSPYYNDWINCQVRSGSDNLYSWQLGDEVWGGGTYANGNRWAFSTAYGNPMAHVFCNGQGTYFYDCNFTACQTAQYVAYGTYASQNIWTGGYCDGSFKILDMAQTLRKGTEILGWSINTRFDKSQSFTAEQSIWRYNSGNTNELAARFFDVATGIFDDTGAAAYKVYNYPGPQERVQPASDYGTTGAIEIVLRKGPFVCIGPLTGNITLSVDDLPDAFRQPEGFTLTVAITGADSAIYTVGFSSAKFLMSDASPPGVNEIRIYDFFHNGTLWVQKSCNPVHKATVTLSALAGASVSTATVVAGGVYPKGATVIGVTSRVTTLITGATSFDIGDGSTVDCFADGIAVALNTTSNPGDGTATTPGIAPVAGHVILTANGSNFTAGEVKLEVYYIQPSVPAI
jgi:hypothetical protein